MKSISNQDQGDPRIRVIRLRTRLGNGHLFGKQVLKTRDVVVEEGVAQLEVSFKSSSKTI